MALVLMRQKAMKEHTKTDELSPKYDFDYSKAKPNRFATNTVNITLEKISLKFSKT